MSIDVDVTAESEPTAGAPTVLDVRDLRMSFTTRSGPVFRRETRTVRAVDGIDLRVGEGETLGIVGESGCGKTSTGRCIVRTYRPTSGELIYHRGDGTTVDLATLSGRDLRGPRREIRMIFQDPFSALNPRMTLFDIIAEPMRVNRVARGSELDDRVAGLLRQVGLRPEYRHRYPHAFSGGERQRAVIARALSLDPRLVVADEAVSALDVSVRAQILNLMQDLQVERGLTYIFISHDLSVVEYLCTRVAVMYMGRIVELAPTSSLYSRPSHPYTEALLASIPRPDPRRRAAEQPVLEGEVADPANPPAGCAFHPRCRFAQEICRTETPALRTTASGHQAACHFADELDLKGTDDELT